MSRLFWKLFLIIWLSIAVLICMLFLLTNIFSLQPPDHEIESRKKVFFLDIGRNLILQGEMDALGAIARTAQVSDPPIHVTVAKLNNGDCAAAGSAPPSTEFVRFQADCYQISAQSLERGPAQFFYLALPFMAAALASLLAAFWLANYLTGPIVTLKDGLNALANGDFRIRIGDKFGGRQDEISNLGLNFDSTAAKLQALQHIQQRLYHDVSHELRSPLSRLQAAIGVLRQNPAKLDVLMVRIEREIERLDALVDEILTLAKLNSGYASSYEKSRIDIIDLLGAIADDAGFEAAAKNVTVELNSVPSFVCAINGELAYRALENIVRNAVKYTAPGTVVSIDASLQERGPRRSLRIFVRDCGPGVPADEMEAIFEPFARGTDTAKVAGHGLGLAIAKQSIEIQGGKISAENAAQGGLVVVIDIIE